MALTVEQAKTWLEDFYNKIEAQKQYLSDLDTPIGDGDHGNNMARGMTAVHEDISDADFASVSDLFKKVAMDLISKVGGASGPLYGTAFLEMSKTASGSTELKDLVSAALAGIEKRGKSTTNEKTMIDVWSPMAEKLNDDEEVSEADIDQFVESTKDMVATKGRASYLGERSVGHIDPGAMSSGYLLKALVEVGV